MERVKVPEGMRGEIAREGLSDEQKAPFEAGVMFALQYITDHPEYACADVSSNKVRKIPIYIEMRIGGDGLEEVRMIHYALAAGGLTKDDQQLQRKQLSLNAKWAAEDAVSSLMCVNGEVFGQPTDDSQKSANG